MPVLLPLADDLQPLWSSILSTPDDRDAHKVLADALQHAGDPRGTWMTLEMRRETLDVAEVHTASRHFLLEHRDHLLGPLADYRDPTHWRMRHGVMHHIGLRVLSEGRCQTLLEDLDQAGLLATVRSLRLLTYSVEQDLLETILRRMPQLERLHIGPVGLGGRRLPTTLPVLLGALKKLTHLTVPPVPSTAQVRHARLTSLGFVPSRRQCERLERSALPELASVALGPLASWGPGDLRALAALQLREIRGPATFRSRWQAAGLAPVIRAVEAKSPDEAVDAEPLLAPPYQAHWRDFALDGARRSIRRLDKRIDIVDFGTEQVVKRASALWAADTYQGHVNRWLREGWTEVAPNLPASQTSGSIIGAVPPD